MNSRFRNKYHKNNHHTYPSGDPHYPDSSYDPIASADSPFSGDFVLAGGLSAMVPSASAYVAALFGKVGIGTASPQAPLHVIGNTTITGNLSVLGQTNFVTTNTTTLSTIVLSNTGTGPALNVTQYGTQPIATFYDNSGNIALWVNGYNSSPASLGVGMSANPQARLSINGNIVAGYNNTVTNLSSTIAGGGYNTGGVMSFIGGGLGNTAAGGAYSVVGGGYYNNASGCTTGIIGGYCNTAYGYFSNIAGGCCNYAYGNFAHIGGGYCNSSFADSTSIGGGYCNSATGSRSFVGGGYCNVASASISNVVGGCCNTACGNASNIAGGYKNTVSGYWASVVGGCCNTNSGSRSSILGGVNNTNSLQNVFILGSNIVAPLTNYTYVNNISSQGIITDTNGNSNNWNGAYSAVSTNSAVVWNYQGTDLKNLSANWQTTANIVSSLSAQWSANSGGSSAITPFIFSSTSITTLSGNNLVTGNYTVISGGSANNIIGSCSNIGGGCGNSITCDYSTIGGGYCNCTSNSSSIIAGGIRNVASGACSTIGGGSVNSATGSYSHIGGGQCNAAGGDSNFIGGGGFNAANNFSSVVGGGKFNCACSAYATIGGGCYNIVTGTNASIVGGYCNIASGNCSSILGGSNNDTKGYSNTIIAGSNLSATQSDTFYANNIVASGYIVGKSKTNSQSGTTYTILTSDSGSIIYSSAGIAGLTAMVVGNGYPDGFETTLIQLSTARIALSGGPGVTINQASGYLKTTKRYSAATLVYIGGSWVLFGDVNA